MMPQVSARGRRQAGTSIPITSRMNLARVWQRARTSGKFRARSACKAAHRAGCVVVQVPDVVPSAGRWAHHLAADLMAGARAAGLV